MVALDGGEDLTFVGGDLGGPAPASNNPATVQHDATMAMPGGFAAASGAPLKLVFTKGPFKGGQQTITAPSFTIGRGQDQNAVWLKDDTVSTQHAEVSQVAGKYFVKDLGSQNGLLVNGKKVIGECDLKNGDKITIGLSTFKIASGGGGGGGGSMKIVAALVGLIVVAGIGYGAMKMFGGGDSGPDNGNGEMVDKGDENDRGFTPPGGGTDTPDDAAAAKMAAEKAAAEEKAAADKVIADKAAAEKADLEARLAAAEKAAADAKMQAEKDAAAAAEAAAAEAVAAKAKEAEMMAAEKAKEAEMAAAKKMADEKAAAEAAETAAAGAEAGAGAVTPKDPIVATTKPEMADKPDATASAAPAVGGFTLGPIDPARKITPSAAIEYKSY
jgi:hypothetical protein